MGRGVTDSEEGEGAALWDASGLSGGARQTAGGGGDLRGGAGRGVNQVKTTPRRGEADRWGRGRSSGRGRAGRESGQDRSGEWRGGRCQRRGRSGEWSGVGWSRARGLGGAVERRFAVVTRTPGRGRRRCAGGEEAPRSGREVVRGRHADSGERSAARDGRGQDSGERSGADSRSRTGLRGEVGGARWSARRLRGAVKR